MWQKPTTDELDKIKKRIGQRLETAIIGAGYESLRDFALRHKMPATTLYQWCNGTRLIDQISLRYISQTTKTNAAYLFCLSENPKLDI